MALTTQEANLVWQEVKIALAQQSSTSPQGIPQVVHNQFAALKAHLAQFKGNPKLDFVPFLATDIDNASGNIVMGFPCTLYGVFARKLATATDVFLYLIDDASDDTGVDVSSASDARVILPLLQTQDIATAFFPQGTPMAAGIVAKAYTMGASSTTLNDSSGSDTPNGFVLIGDPI
jgi:hypothetical protein